MSLNHAVPQDDNPLCLNVLCKGNKAYTPESVYHSKLKCKAKYDCLEERYQVDPVLLTLVNCMTLTRHNSIGDYKD